MASLLTLPLRLQSDQPLHALRTGILGVEGYMTIYQEGLLKGLPPGEASRRGSAAAPAAGGTS
eukprot:5682707-Pyramimonas_sp.AAC.1